MILRSPRWSSVDPSVTVILVITIRRRVVWLVARHSSQRRVESYADRDEVHHHVVSSMGESVSPGWARGDAGEVGEAGVNELEAPALPLPEAGAFGGP